MRIPFRSHPWLLGPALVLTLWPAAGFGASHDPTRTVTIYLHGFEQTGADRHGVYGEDVREPLADSVAALVGLPTAGVNGPLPVNAVVGTTYYGDTAPAYYSAEDRAEVDALTAQWGGGVPRYALIAAKYARHVLERSGAQQVNIVSASFGTLVARWLIEKNVEGLAGDGKIARWLTLEGVLAGNWAASHDDLVDILSWVGPEPVDILHMQYGWVETNLHAPRADTDSPFLANVLIGQVASTDDRGNYGALRDAMLVLGEYASNDGVQSVADAMFRSVAAAARFHGRQPTSALFHADHLGLANQRAAWAQAAIFLTSTRRVTVTMKSARVVNLHEASAPWWDWRPAEVLFEARVYSPAAQARWSLTGPMSAHLKSGAAAPLHRFQNSGETKQLAYVLFDDFILPNETELRLDLHAWELDYDPRYGVLETIQTPHDDDMGGGTRTVSTLGPGVYEFTTADWSCQIEVAVFDYPFQSLVGVGNRPAAGSAGSLAISPQPASSQVRITAGIGLGGARDTKASLEIVDVAGRVVRRMEGSLGRPFHWDGRDARGSLAPAGVYLARVLAAGDVRRGRICLVR